MAKRRLSEEELQRIDATYVASLPVADKDELMQACRASTDAPILVIQTDAQLIAAMAKHPILIERPVVRTRKGTRLCRPPERLRDIL